MNRFSEKKTEIDQVFSGRPAYDKITGYIQKAKAAGGEILIGGTGTSTRFCTDFSRLKNNH
jgi:acyl-CoA reductase-like NAD-dependent aldehyde dehydrogenase